MDIFEQRNISPMLIKEQVAPFDDPEFIYELKLNGMRCIAFLDHAKGTELFNKRKISLNSQFPELLKMHEQIRGRCILDGEVFVMREGKPSFSSVQKRAMMTDKYRIHLQSSLLPASFTAFDILYYRGRDITKRSLIERKDRLLKSVVSENDSFSYSRFIEEKGSSLYQLTKEQNLVGIVPKRKDSKYYFGRETVEWLKIKNMLEDDYVILGYITKEAHFRTLILGQYQKTGFFIYKGHVTGISKSTFNIIQSIPSSSCPFDILPAGNDKAVWIKPVLVCRVRFMEYTRTGGMRQPIFDGLRDDKEPKECLEKNSTI